MVSRTVPFLITVPRLYSVAAIVFIILFLIVSMYTSTDSSQHRRSRSDGYYQTARFRDPLEDPRFLGPDETAFSLLGGRKSSLANNLFYENGDFLEYDSDIEDSDPEEEQMNIFHRLLDTWFGSSSPKSAPGVYDSESSMPFTGIRGSSGGSGGSGSTNGVASGSQSAALEWNTNLARRLARKNLLLLDRVRTLELQLRAVSQRWEQCSAHAQHSDAQLAALSDLTAAFSGSNPGGGDPTSGSSSVWSDADGSTDVGSDASNPISSVNKKALRSFCNSVIGDSLNPSGAFGVRRASIGGAVDSVDGRTADEGGSRDADPAVTNEADDDDRLVGVGTLRADGIDLQLLNSLDLNREDSETLVSGTSLLQSVRLGDQWPSPGFVVLLPDGRVGSAWLQSMLNQCENITMRDDIIGFGKVQSSVMKRSLRANFTLPILQGNVAPGKRLGFQTRVSVLLEDAHLHRMLIRARPKIVFFQRRNMVQRLVSRQRGELLRKQCGGQNGLIEFDKTNCTIPDKVSFPLETFRNLVEFKERSNYMSWSYVQRLAPYLPTMELFYEDLSDNTATELKRIYDFLGVQCSNKVATGRKPTKPNMRDAIENFDELYTAYKSTPYAEQFTGDRDVFYLPMVLNNRVAKLDALLESYSAESSRNL